MNEVDKTGEPRSTEDLEHTMQVVKKHLIFSATAMPPELFVRMTTIKDALEELLQLRTKDDGCSVKPKATELKRVCTQDPLRAARWIEELQIEVAAVRQLHVQAVADRDRLALRNKALEFMAENVEGALSRLCGVFHDGIAVVPTSYVAQRADRAWVLIQEVIADGKI